MIELVNISKSYPTSVLYNELNLRLNAKDKVGLTRSQANEKIFEYIEIFYNRKRIHSSNNYMSPSEFEDEMLLKEIAI